MDWLVLSSPNGTVPTLTVSRNAIIQAGGGIIADGTGYPAGQGQGAGRSISTSTGYVGERWRLWRLWGGGSGGSPTSGGWTYYDSACIAAGARQWRRRHSGPPTWAGAGGGGIHLNVTGTLQVDGRISAAGGAGGQRELRRRVWRQHLADGGDAGRWRASSPPTAARAMGWAAVAAAGASRSILDECLPGLCRLMAAAATPEAAPARFTPRPTTNYRDQLLVDNGGQAGTNTSWTRDQYDGPDGHGRSRDHPAEWADCWATCWSPPTAGSA